MSGATTWAIGVDMGGTFVDAVAIGSDGRLSSLKHPRDSNRPAASVLAAVDRLCAENGIAPSAVSRLVHGSTIVTNLLLEQEAGPVAVITTAGFRDVLTLARQDRQALYEPVIAPPTADERMFPARLRFEIAGRIDAEGREATPLDLEAMASIAAAIEAAGVRAAAVCLLFAQREPRHEQQVRAALLARLPGLTVSLSSEVDAKPREYERFLATALDAYAKPVVAQYLAELAAALGERGLPEPWLMRSEGGTGRWQDLARLPASLAMSGPSAALQGVAASLGGLATAAGSGPGHGPRLLTLDVGGTSTDMGVIESGRPAYVDTMRCGGFSLRLRSADVESLALGGGSVVEVGVGRALRLGPHSQGASPGPAAHGQGGDRATLTDALCVLGRLPPRLNEALVLYRRAAETVLDRHVARPLGLSTLDAAEAVVRAAASAMAESLKMRSFQRGLDPADTTLVAVGGGGGQHAAEVAELAGIARVRVLAHAGVASALGMLCAAPSETVERSCDWLLDEPGLRRLSTLAAELPRAPVEATTHWWLALCDPGQEFSIEIDWQPALDTLDALRQRYVARHVSLRGAVPSAPTTQVRLLRRVAQQPLPSPSPYGRTREATAWRGVARSGAGPCALFAPTTTVWVPAGWTWQRMDDDSLALEHSGHVAGSRSGASVVAIMEPLRLALQGIVDRMQAGMTRAAYSSIAREGGDCAAAVFLPDGRLLAQARSLPLLLGSLIPAVAGILRRFPPSTMSEGDGYLLNDPWSGGTHLPDLFVLRPVLQAGRVIALAATCLHHQDVGGMTPGSIPPGATDVYQEGLRLPPLRWRDAAGPDAGVAAILEANTRTPLNLRGDMGAQWSAVSLGARELAALAARLGALFEPGCDALIGQSEDMTRSALRAAPDGSWSWLDRMDGAHGAPPLAVAVQVAKRGDTIVIDFEGSSGQARGPINASPASMLSAALFFMRTLAPEAPNNAGCLAPLTLRLPAGSIVNPDFPAAVNARTATVKLACNAMLGAWSRAGAGVSVAPHAGVATVIAMSGTRADGRPWVLTEIIASGAGASALGPGRTGVSTDIGNARNTPVEVLESEAPLRIECYEARHGSGGSGLHRGGDGVRRVYRLIEGTAVVSYRGERHRSQARGALGGGPGASANALVRRVGGQVEVLDARQRVELHAGDRLVIETAGAGGWGAADASAARTAATADRPNVTLEEGNVP